jgi:seryl-tRNA synthetase
MSDHTFDFSTLTDEQKRLIFNEMLEKQKGEEAEVEKEIRELEEKKKKYNEKLSRVNERLKELRLKSPSRTSTSTLSDEKREEINEKRREKVPCGKCNKETSLGATRVRMDENNEKIRVCRKCK